MAVLSSAILSSLFLNTKINVISFYDSRSRSHPLINISRTPTNRPSSKYNTIVACNSEIELGEKEKKILLEQYGYDADEHLSPPSSKSRRRNRDTPKAGRRKQEPPKDTVPPQAQPPPMRPQTRTTHKLLQVLGGKARRKKLLSPKGMDVRPMMEVVKGAVFDILQAAGGCPGSLRPGTWLDLYSGTGSVGIEAISRGCSEVHFVEMDPWVVSDVLQPNLKSTGFLDVAVIHTLRVEKFLERAEQLVGKLGPFGYVSVTPPYTQVDYGILMEQLSRSKLIGEDTFVVVEYPSRTEMLDSCACLPMITDRRFGRTYLAIYGPTWAQKKRKSESP